MLVRNISIAALLIAGSVLGTGPVLADTTFDLNGATIGGVTPSVGIYQNYNFTFTATSAATALSFTFQNDSGYTGLDDVSVTPVAGGSNLVLNGGFELGGVFSAGLGALRPVDWSAIVQAGVAPAGYLNSGVSAGTAPLTAHSGTAAWADGTSNGFDGISQSFATTPDAQYNLSFWASSFPGFSAGTDQTVVTLGAAVPSGFSPVSDTASVPEPSAVWLLAAGMTGLVLVRRKRLPV